MSVEGETWKRIGEILIELEWYDKATSGRFRQSMDREALDIVTRIERKMKRELAKIKPK
jgi:hypothetical protein